MSGVTIRKTSPLLIVGILVIAACLRAPITGTAPLLKLISSEFGLSAAAGSLLTTLPLLAFGGVSPLAAALARVCGLERALFYSLLLVIAGITFRAIGPVTALFVGTVVIGGGIAIGNVLLPSLIKRDFPSGVSTFTAAYSLTMGVGAAITSAVAIPLTELSGFTWRLTTGMVVLLPILGAIIWLPQLANHSSSPKSSVVRKLDYPVWSSMLAWQVTLFFGLNSLVFYSGISWLPAILHDAGYSTEKAGSLHGLLQFAGASASFVFFPLIRWIGDQRIAAFSASTITLTGLLGLLLAPSWAPAWTILFGLGTGGGIITGLSLVSLRASDAQHAAKLSGMAQSIGYLLAAAGPLLTGFLRDIFGTWGISLALCALLCVVMAIFGLLAGASNSYDAYSARGQVAPTRS